MNLHLYQRHQLQTSRQQYWFGLVQLSLTNTAFISKLIGISYRITLHVFFDFGQYQDIVQPSVTWY
ncbi:hypothetical protein [Nostoc linckia]|uniref:hypothetical protein n=1 Tax=Nostoc linckia TaxID=92942 RepID=UPI0015D51901|nr:hypothetical protein [Nostoc linckia]